MKKIGYMMMKNKFKNDDNNYKRFRDSNKRCYDWK